MKRFLTLWMLLLLLGAPALAQSVPADVPQEEAEAVPHEERLTVGDSGDAVAQLQTKLSELYYYTGDITGSYGEVTAAAVSAFQWDFGLEGTGIADQATLDAIREASRRPLRLGCVGEDVRQLQVRLMALGFYEGSVSGTYLPSTESAVYTFQLACGEIATGEADLDTLTLLYQEDAITYAQSADALPSPTPTAPPMVIVAEVEITPMPTVAYEKKLKYESKGELVKTLQQRLTDLGYYSGNISGNFLGNTRNAVKAFQQQNALEVDGVVGEMTWNALFNDPDVRAADDAPKPTPEPTPVPYAITVDVQNQVTTVYGLDENGQYTKVVRQMLCSTGTKSAPSDVGDWVLTGRTARWCDFPKWGGHAQFWTKINDSIAFHSVIYSDYDTMKLNTSSYKKLGQRASHGCIRLTVADARWIYENCGAGVVVTITEDLPADPELR
ncbi:MAG: murein L,D-transpeptidase, partial [Clostridia bacterium]|nr:murein L,D-transpeptidase [Clostridia bacterium]